MGETGILGLTTTMAVVAFLTNTVLLLPLIGFILFLEIGSIILLANVLLAYLVYYYKYLSRLLVAGAAVIQLFIFVQAYFLAYLNF